jgi:cytochrome b561
MPMVNTAPARYTAPAIALHWLLAVAILGSMTLGAYMSGLNFSPLQLKLYNWHKWAGITILALSLLRLVWRLTHKPPPLPQRIEFAMPRWQLRAYHATHGLMYALFFAVPLMGWAYSSMAGFPVVWFGVLPLPDFVPVDKEFAKVIKPLHGLLAYTLLALVLLHVGAALKHQFIDRDGLLARMRPGRR